MSSDPTPLSPGLYLVATPIGNLGDISLRALDVLRAASLIACEDTRQTQKLLNHFAIQARTISYHMHNERERSAELLAAITSGKAVALVSDAGTPGINDPGGWLVAEAIAAGVPVIPIPGANAALAALVASGLTTEEFVYLGFLPEKAGARRTRLEDLAALPRDHAQTLIFYEAPHRILDTLADIEATFGDLPRVVAARELTKLHEEFLRGAVSEIRRNLAARDRIRGEFVLLLEAPPRAGHHAGAPGPSPLGTGEIAPPLKESVSARVARLHADEGLDEKDALKRLARETGQSKSELYRELQRERARRK